MSQHERCLGCGTLDPDIRRVGHVVGGDMVVLRHCVDCGSVRVAADDLRNVAGGTRAAEVSQ